MTMEQSRNNFQFWLSMHSTQAVLLELERHSVFLRSSALLGGRLNTQKSGSYFVTVPM